MKARFYDEMLPQKFIVLINGILAWITTAQQQRQPEPSPRRSKAATAPHHHDVFRRKPANGRVPLQSGLMAVRVEVSPTETGICLSKSMTAFGGRASVLGRRIPRTPDGAGSERKPSFLLISTRLAYHSEQTSSPVAIAVRDVMDPKTMPRKLWEHPNPKETEMWQFMQDCNGRFGLNMQVSPTTNTRIHVLSQLSPHAHLGHQP